MNLTMYYFLIILLGFSINTISTAFVFLTLNERGVVSNADRSDIIAATFVAGLSGAITTFIALALYHVHFRKSSENTPILENFAETVAFYDISSYKPKPNPINNDIVYKTI